MVTSFTANNHTVQVFTTEDKALTNTIYTAFVMSLEDLYKGLHCDNIDTCDDCPIKEECSEHGDTLPHYLLTTYHQQWISDHPEYLL